METEITVQGRRLGPGDVAWLQGWIDENPAWSRKPIARDLCRRWDWVDGRGRLKDFEARRLLLKLESRGRVKLPAWRTQFRRARPQVREPEGWEEPSRWVAALGAIAPGRLERVRAGSAEARRWAFYLERSRQLREAPVPTGAGALFLAARRSARKTALSCWRGCNRSTRRCSASSTGI